MKLNTVLKIRGKFYYPFGMLMPQRNFAVNGTYKFGFSGKENDNEVKGTANQQDYGMRIYDTRVCKFLSVDPLTKKFAELSPYQYAANTPIMATDLDGGEPNEKVSAKNIQFGMSIVFGGNQERGIKLFASYAGVSAHKGFGIEGGLRIGVNMYGTFKGADNIIECTASWYAGAVFGGVSKSEKMVMAGDEFRFAGSGIPADMHGGSWGIGGIGMLTSKYKGNNISGYMGTQYIKGNFGNTSLTLNHSNDAMMGGFWLKKALPPILGFLNTDWNRTTELSASLNISNTNSAVSAYGRVSLFTPKILIENGERQSIETGAVNNNGDRQRQYVLDPKSHGTFFSFGQVGIIGMGNFDGANGSVGLNYSWGNPQPAVQNKFAHGNGYRFPLFVPSPGTSANQSTPSVGGSASIVSQ